MPGPVMSKTSALSMRETPTPAAIVSVNPCLPGALGQMYVPLRGEQASCPQRAHIVHPDLLLLGIVDNSCLPNSFKGKQTNPPSVTGWFLVRMHPDVGSDLACLGQLDHVHGRRVSRRSAGSAFQRRLKFPDRRIAQKPDCVRRNSRSG
jgi:hypothetical protein